jgi:hypothetical protein
VCEDHGGSSIGRVAEHFLDTRLIAGDMFWPILGSTKWQIACRRRSATKRWVKRWVNGESLSQLYKESAPGPMPSQSVGFGPVKQSMALQNPHVSKEVGNPHVW